jgi:hypothetical protein
MNDPLNELFRARFAEHEAPVPSGAWEAIRTKLSDVAVDGGNDPVDALFRERFQGHEMPVDPSVWANIGAQLGHPVAAGTASGLAGVWGWAAAGVGVLVVAGGLYLNSTGTPEVELTASPEPVTPELTTSVDPDPMDKGSVEPTAITSEIGDDAGAAESVVLRTAPSLPAEPSSGNTTVAPAPERKSMPAPPATAPPTATPEGAVIVENIISELTTRVTEEVLAEAAQRNTLSNAATQPEPSATATPESPAEEVALPELYIQNIFTPNGDGVNDTYSAVINPEAFDRVMLRIYDVRNSRLVFSTNNNEPWTGDGYPDGYYMVAVEALTPDGRLVTQGKAIWLNRESNR